MPEYQDSDMAIYFGKCFKKVHAMLTAELKKPDSSPLTTGVLLDIEGMLVDTAKEVHEETIKRVLAKT